MTLYEWPELYDELLPAEPGCIQHYRRLAVDYGGPVLELACGTGQLTAAIGADGIEVVGIDLALPMLHAARRRLLAAGAKGQLVGADMRQFQLRRSFNLIFIARNSLLHLTSNEELTACFRLVRRHLAGGGAFAFDVFNPNPGLLARTSGRRYEVLRRRTGSFGEIVVEETPAYDAATQVNRATWYVTADGREAGVFPLHLRSVFPQELSLLVRHCGFEMETRSGGYGGEPWSSSAMRQVVVCRLRRGSPRRSR